MGSYKQKTGDTNMTVFFINFGIQFNIVSLSSQHHKSHFFLESRGNITFSSSNSTMINAANVECPLKLKAPKLYPSNCTLEEQNYTLPIGDR